MEGDLERSTPVVDTSGRSLPVQVCGKFREGETGRLASDDRRDILPSRPRQEDVCPGRKPDRRAVHPVLDPPAVDAPAVVGDDGRHRRIGESLFEPHLAVPVVERVNPLPRRAPFAERRSRSAVIGFIASSLAVPYIRHSSSPTGSGSPGRPVNGRSSV
jgi:hypothetical protein